MSTHYAQTLPFGAELLGAERTRFRLWAPAVEQVHLEVEGLTPVPMTRGDDGVHEAIVGCGAGSRYRYRLRPDLAVADPASRRQSGDVHGWSVVVDPRAHRWVHADWVGRPWRETVLYELHVGLCGGYDGVRERLPKLAALGITAIELMPIADFPGRHNWGYDGVLPYAPDEAYGSTEALKRLIDAAHGHGLMMFLDVVYNHFGPDGNYLHVYAPSFFDSGESSPWGAAIDFTQPQVREFFTANALYWLNEYRFDGLRFDAVHAIADPGWLDEAAARIHAGVEPGRHVHLVLENEHNRAEHLRHGFAAQWNDDGHNVLHVLMTGEDQGYYANYVEHPADKLARCLAQGFVYQGEASPSHGGRLRGSYSADLPPTAFVLFLQNHDQIGNRAFGDRLTRLVAPAALDAAIALQLLCPQIPLLFMGEETGSRSPFLFFTDFHDELADAVREGRRREFAAFTEFNDAESRARIPDPNAPQTYLDSQPLPGDEANRRMSLYSALLALRARFIVPRLDGASSAGAQALGAAGVLADWRLGDGSRLSIACNLSTAATACPAYGETFQLLHESRIGAAADVRAGRLPGPATVVFLEPTP